MINLSSVVLRKEGIFVPEWTPDMLYVQEMTGGQISELKKYVKMVNGEAVAEHEVALVIVMSVVDKDGKFIFAEADIPALEAQPITLITRVFAACSRVSGLSADVNEAKNSLKNSRKRRSTSG